MARPAVDRQIQSRSFGIIKACDMTKKKYTYQFGKSFMKIYKKKCKVPSCAHTICIVKTENGVTVTLFADGYTHIF